MVLNALRARTRLPIRSAAGLGRRIGAPHGKGDAIQKAAARVRSIRCSQLVDQDVTSFVQWAQRSGRSPSQNRRHGCCSARSARGAAAAALWAHLDGRLAELFATARLELRALLSGPVDGPRCVGPLGHDFLRLRGHGPSEASALLPPLPSFLGLLGNTCFWSCIFVKRSTTTVQPDTPHPAT